MSSDLIPTFRRLATSIAAASRSGRLWRALGRLALSLSALSAFGLAGAAFSRNACEQRVRRMITANTSHLRVQPRWASRDEVGTLPLSQSFLGAPPGSSAFTTETASVFSPTVTYLPIVSPVRHEADPTVVWAFVTTKVSLPFIARSHWVVHWSSPVLGPSTQQWFRYGGQSIGATTCLCAFGLAVPINVWERGFTYN